LISGCFKVCSKTGIRITKRTCCSPACIQLLSDRQRLPASYTVAYLRRLPLDLLKIDQSFTRGIGVEENDEEIVRLIISMAHAMDLEVICEGVETREQLDFLQRYDCDLAQGYYFSKPKSVGEITDMFIAERDGRLNIMDGAK